MQTVDLPGLQRIATVCYAARIPLLVLGAPGSGKTSFFQGFAAQQEPPLSGAAREMAEQKGIAFHSESAAHCSPEDIGGLPDLSGSRTTYRLPDWLPLDGEPGPESGILMFDDVADAPRAVQASLYELVCSRTIRGRRIKSGWWIVSACNRPEDLAASEPVSFAFANRGAVVTYEPTTADTATLASRLDWASPLPEFYAWTSAMKRELPKPNMEQVAAGDYAQPTNRSRGLLSCAIKAGMAQNDYASLVGCEESVQILEYVTLLSTLPTLQSILASPQTAPVPDKLGAQFAVAAGIARHTQGDPAGYANLEPYVTRLSKPLISFYRALVRDKVPHILSAEPWSRWAKAIDVAPEVK